eukprot:c22444_g1_i1 orf=104-1621(+)
MEWLPRLDRLWWWLALVSIVSLLGQEIARSSAFALVSGAEFEGFGDESEDLEEESDLQVVVPPPVVRRSGFETDRGPPSLAKEGDANVAADGDSVGFSSSDRPTEDGGSKDSVGDVFVESKAQQKSRHDFWDEDEFEGLPPVEEQELASNLEGDSGTESAGGRGLNKNTAVPIGPQSYYFEVCCIIFLVAFAFTYFIGRKENEAVALAWAAQYACKDGILEKNFSLLGTGDGPDAPLLIKEGQNVFKFYASGRRYCQGLLSTMELQSRHDLLARIWYIASPRRDEMTIDVYMNDENMEPVTFALVRKKIAKTMHREEKDLQLYATILSSQTQRKWVSEDLAVISESRELAMDLLTDSILDQVFGEKAFEKYGRYFVSLHFTDQFSFGSHKKVLQFKFILPLANRMADMAKLIAMVPYYIDLVGRLKLSAQSRARAEAARAKVAQEAFKEAQSARQEALQKKRDERRKALDDSELKLTPDALHKKEEKERLRQLKKSMPRIKMTRA